MYAKRFKSFFLLDPDITFLNFGSFGACPVPVFDNYQFWQRELEREPVQFITVKGPRLLKEARDALGRFVGADGDDLVFVTNPSYAVNIIAKSLDLKPGDEVLGTSLEYGACDKTWAYCCEKAGAKYIRAEIPLPLTTGEAFTEALFSWVSPRTRLIFMSHITSATALKLPVHEVCVLAKKKGLITFIDGAHAPGHVPLNIGALGADIYTGACHKWMMAPKGSSFLYVHRSLQGSFDPLVVSWGYDSSLPPGSRFIEYHQLQGTRDFSAFLSVPEAIRFMETHDWPVVSGACARLARDWGPRFFSLLDARPLSPLTPDYVGQMLSIAVRTKEPEKLQRVLYEEYRIEIPVMRHGTACYLRYSINAFNGEDDLDKLYATLGKIINKSDLLEKGKNGS